LAQSNVTVYGSFNVAFERVQREDATASAVPLNSMVGAPGANPAEFEWRNRVTSTNSSLGFRGTEDLGGGLKAIFQCESFANIDNGSLGPGGTILCNRNSHVGLTGSWGTVFYGFWDTPYKVVTIKVDSFTLYDGNHEIIMGSPGFNVQGTTRSGRDVSAADAAFIRRQGNSVQYWTPNFGGFYGRFGYSANEQKDLVGGTEIDPYIWSAAVFFERGPVYLAYGYENHNDYFGVNGMLAGTAPGAVTPIGPLNSSSEDTGHKIAAGYTFGNTTIGVMLERLEYENDDSSGLATRVEEYERDAWYLTLVHKMGLHAIRVIYGQADEGDCELAGAGNCTTSDLDVTHWGIGYTYDLSKRTELFAYYTKVDNERAASYNLASGGAIGGAIAGSDPEAYGLAIRHRF
jgi:predicted porin